MKRAFHQVDVFTDTALYGNPLAVVHDADDLSDEAMRAVARWTNLSETTFLLRPTTKDAHYRVRIFTPNGELPFAGHPTLGSCHAYLEAGGREDGVIVQECAVGLVRIHRDGPRLAFEAPPLARTPIDPVLSRAILAALGVPTEAVKASARLENGPVWHAFLLDSAERVLATTPDFAALAKLGKAGIVAPHEAGAPCRFEVRAFAPSIGVPEDPVTGSLQAALGEWLVDEGHAPSRYVAAQGARLGRRGRVHVERAGGRTLVGGDVVTCVAGTIALDPTT